MAATLLGRLLVPWSPRLTRVWVSTASGSKHTWSVGDAHYSSQNCGPSHLSDVFGHSDSEAMSLGLTQASTLDMVLSWRSRQSATKWQLQLLISHLSHAAFVGIFLSPYNAWKKQAHFCEINAFRLPFC